MGPDGTPQPALRERLCRQTRGIENEPAGFNNLLHVWFTIQTHAMNTHCLDHEATSCTSVASTSLRSVMEKKEKLLLLLLPLLITTMPIVMRLKRVVDLLVVEIIITWHKTRKCRVMMLRREGDDLEWESAGAKSEIVMVWGKEAEDELRRIEGSRKLLHHSNRLCCL